MGTVKSRIRDIVMVTFNGQDQEVDYQPNQALRALLEAAKNAFGLQGQHLLSLFTEDGVELLEESSSVADNGIRPGQLLILRQSTVKGG